MYKKQGRSLLEWENADLTDSELSLKHEAALEDRDKELASLIERELIDRMARKND